MQIPKLCGTIDRRILANYRVDPDVVRRILPIAFRPKLVDGYAIAGICLIRLKNIRPKFLPVSWGLQSENAAHRIAVEWDSNGQPNEGVFVPRRDTSSWLNCLAGGRLFPGVQHHAKFTVRETADAIAVSVQSDDNVTRLAVEGTVSDCIGSSSVFSTLAAASEFFKKGSTGYSATGTPGHFDGMELCCGRWHVEPMEVHRIDSSFFEDETVFPKGSIAFDCALLMRGIEHEWCGRSPMSC